LIRLINISEETGLIAESKSRHFNSIVNSVKLNEIPYSFGRSFASCDNVIISATGYTGSGRFELYATNSDTVKI
jgi:aminomethyltransferase